MVVNFSRHRVAKETKHAKNSVNAALTQVQVVTTVMAIIDKIPGNSFHDARGLNVVRRRQELRKGNTDTRLTHLSGRIGD